MIIKEVIKDVVSVHTTGQREEWNLSEIVENYKTIVGHYFQEPKIDQFENPGGIADFLYEDACARYGQKEKELSAEIMRKLERLVMLRIIDNLWQDHLDEMDYLRTGVGLRGYGQRDPLIEYKHEAYNLYKQLQLLINDQIAKTIYKVTIIKQPMQPVQGKEIKPDAGSLTKPGPVATATSTTAGTAVKTYSRGTSQSNMPPAQKGPLPTGKVQTITRDEEKIGRNDPCPCGSGKKYKKCHGA